jgi:murein L,D-transpeptidase YafK
MFAIPKRGARSLVATLAATFVLPALLAGQELGGPMPHGDRPVGAFPGNAAPPMLAPGTAADPPTAGAATRPPAPSIPLGRPVESPLERLASGPTPDLASGMLTGLASAPAAGFRDQQLRYPRVRSAYETRAADVRQIFQRQGIEAPAEIFFRVFKREQLMEVWARGDADRGLVLVNTYAMCGTSGVLGGKRARGDAQIPEGFYTIDIFNPSSQFHLSLGVSYPNAVDRFRGVATNLGGDIFVHGGCATIGCVPITDAGIEEVYLMALMARDAGQSRIPIHLFPTRLDDDGFAWLRDTFGTHHPEFDFWENLREGYLAFESTRIVPEVDHHQGRYTFPRGIASPSP